MGIKINKCHGKPNRSKRGSISSIEYIVDHYTGGTGSAKNNCLYFGSADRRSSADYFIDTDGAIWEYNNPKDGYFSWHCGDGAGRYGITNANSIGIEVVNNGGAFTSAQVKALAELHAYLRQVYGTKLKIVRHYDASRKQCPLYYVPQSKWNSLKKSVDKQPSSSTPSKSKGAKYKITTPSGVNIRKDSSTSAKIVGAYKKGTQVTVTATKTVGKIVWGRTSKGWFAIKQNGKSYATKC